MSEAAWTLGQKKGTWTSTPIRLWGQGLVQRHKASFVICEIENYPVSKRVVARVAPQLTIYSLAMSSPTSLVMLLRCCGVHEPWRGRVGVTSCGPSRCRCNTWGITCRGAASRGNPISTVEQPSGRLSYQWKEACRRMLTWWIPHHPRSLTMADRAQSVACLVRVRRSDTANGVPKPELPHGISGRLCYINRGWLP